MIAERERREREERERLARIEQERKDREERERLLAASTVDSASTDDVEANLSWDYQRNNIYVPPTYKTKIVKEGWPFPEYVWETTVDRPGYSYSELENVYFSVRLKNTTAGPRKVTFRITAQERFSVGKVVGNTWNTSLWAIAGAAGAALLSDALDTDIDPRLGAAVGAGYELDRQQRNDEWFQKAKTFTVTLDPYAEHFESGSFRVKKSLTDSPEVEIVRVE